MIKKLLTTCSPLLILFLAGCFQNPKNELKVAATSVPHAEILEFIKPELKTQGIDLAVIVTDDYTMPNRALADKEVDANFFQHVPYLEEQIRQFNYPLVSYAKVENEPMGIYSKRLTSIAALEEGATIAVPNDPSNEARALLLFHQQNVITLDDPKNLQATILNIKTNPKKLKFIEMDAAMMPRVLEDVDAAAVNTNYALSAHLHPTKDALVLEGKDAPYVNIVAIRDGDENRPELQALKAALMSEKTKEFILQKYQGAVLPAF